MSSLRAFAKRVPGLAFTYRALKEILMSENDFDGASAPLRIVDPARVFAEIFRERRWGSSESLSGTGSDLQQTSVIRDELPKLCAELGVLRLLDIPCGDFYWMQHTDLSGIHYVGADIVAEMIEQNSLKYGNPFQGREFLKLNLCEDPLPDVDLVFCRDCLVHLSNSDVIKALRNISRSNAKYLLTTTFTNRKRNIDIPTGDWRVINLTLPPFSLLRPVMIINERCTEYGTDYADKSLALWRIRDVATVIAGSTCR